MKLDLIIKAHTYKRDDFQCRFNHIEIKEALRDFTSTETNIVGVYVRVEYKNPSSKNRHRILEGEAKWQ